MNPDSFCPQFRLQCLLCGVAEMLIRFSDVRGQHRLQEPEKTRSSACSVLQRISARSTPRSAGRFTPQSIVLSTGGPVQTEFGDARHSIHFRHVEIQFTVCPSWISGCMDCNECTSRRLSIFTRTASLLKGCLCWVPSQHPCPPLQRHPPVRAPPRSAGTWGGPRWPPPPVAPPAQPWASPAGSLCSTVPTARPRGEGDYLTSVREGTSDNSAASIIQTRKAGVRPDK